MNTRTAYPPLPKLTRATGTLKAPERHWGVEVPGFGPSALVFLFSVVASSSGLLLFALAQGDDEPNGDTSALAAILLFVAAGLFVGSIASIFPRLGRRAEAFEKIENARRGYIDSNLLPFAELSYGISKVEDPRSLLRGGTSSAEIDGASVTVILVEDEAGDYLFADGREARRVEEGSGGAEAVLLFPYSMDHRAETGNGSLHASADGGYFGDSSGGDGDGGGDGGGGD